MIYEKALAEYSRLDEQISELEQQLKGYPEGKIFISRNGNRYKWYQTDGHTQVYIPKKQRSLAEKLAVKKYLAYQLDAMKQEKSAIGFYLRHHSNISNSADSMIAEVPGYQELLLPYFKPISEELNDWMNQAYNSNMKYPEQLIHKASSGKLVRSKSEMLIDMALYTNKIPFRYECELQLGDSIIYPDFTIRHPKTGETYYWEHFGMMDDMFYIKNACAKVQLYATHGITPGIHLIMTFETQKNPLSIEKINGIIEEYFSEWGV